MLLHCFLAACCLSASSPLLLAVLMRVWCFHTWPADSASFLVDALFDCRSPFLDIKQDLASPAASWSPHDQRFSSLFLTCDFLPGPESALFLLSAELPSCPLSWGMSPSSPFAPPFCSSPPPPDPIVIVFHTAAYFIGWLSYRLTDLLDLG